MVYPDLSASIFSETPVTEERGRQLLAQMNGTPVPARIGYREEVGFDDDLHDDDDP